MGSIEFSDYNSSDPSVIVSPSAPQKTKELWFLHGHPWSTRFSSPDLVTLGALVRHNARVFPEQTAFLYPKTSEKDTSYAPVTWYEFDQYTETIAASYLDTLQSELEVANASKEQPTVALLGQGNTFEYFVTELALQKLNLRVLLLAHGNALPATHHLLQKCNAVAAVVESRFINQDLAGIKKINMVEEILQNNPKAIGKVEAFKFEDGRDPWERQTYIIHSSGSTGMPKPIIHTNRSMMLIARMYRIFPEFHIENWFLLFPVYHIAGISTALSGFPNGQALSFPPRIWPPSSSAILAAWNTLGSMGYPIDCVHCAPTLIENLHDHLSTNGNDFTPLSSLKILQPGGARLSDSIVSSLVEKGCNVKSTYGSTEIGPPFRTIPHTRDNPRCYAFRNLYPDNPKIEMQEIGEGMYECIVWKGFELAAELWIDKPEDEPYRTNDMFIQDPPNSGLFVLQGRKDDMLVHSNGENTNALPLEMDIVASSDLICKAAILGHSRPCTAAILELTADPSGPSVRQKVWEAIQEVNKKQAAHSKIMQSMIYIVPEDTSLPITPKGNVKRGEVLKIFSKEIEDLYSALENGASDTTESQDPDEPLSLFIHRAVANLCNVPASELDPSTSFYDLGINSILSLSLRATLSKRLGPMSLGVIFEQPSVEQLVTYFENKDEKDVKKDYTALINDMIETYSNEIKSWQGPTHIKERPGDEGEVILLTGASGGLGITLLESLTRSPKVSKIYALLRGSDPETRLYNAIQARGLDAQSLFSTNKIQPLTYDMTSPLLGLPASTYQTLQTTTTTILHNAWKVNFNQPLPAFASDCIRGTLNLLHFATTSSCFPPPQFLFTSSIAASMGPAAPPTIPTSLLPHSPLNPLPTGYAQSKYIIERLLETYTATHHKNNQNHTATILRVGQLCGDTRTGWWSTNDMWPIMFKTSSHLGILPTLKYGSQTVDWVPIDIAADTIRDIILSSSSPTPPKLKIHNITNPHPIPWSTLQTHLLSSLPLSPHKHKPLLTPTPLPTWTKTLKLLSQQQNPPPPSISECPGLKLLDFFEGMADEEEEEEEGEGGGGESEEKGRGNERIFNTEATCAVSERLRNCGEVGGGWVEKWVEGWKGVGFL
ncbi:MAG: putative NRPS-like protein biosynthetic cluster [Cirrosporium novae-zelandiae]|nr:MAG: putative NRPS-like protein biosynthetic cluster [Cirrosporium novae-zelandiae]